jgi:hypothetical protein
MPLKQNGVKGKSEFPINTAFPYKGICGPRGGRFSQPVEMISGRRSKRAFILSLMLILRIPSLEKMPKQREARRAAILKCG